MLQKLGQSLMDIKDGSLCNFQVAEVANIGIQLVYHVKNIHDQGMLHNDIKPDNIMVTSNTGQDESLENKEVVIIDYGLAESYRDSKN